MRGRNRKDLSRYTVYNDLYTVFIIDFEVLINYSILVCFLWPLFVYGDYSSMVERRFVAPKIRVQFPVVAPRKKLSLYFDLAFFVFF